MKTITCARSLILFLLTSCADSDQLGLNFVSAQLNDANWTGAPEISLDSQNNTLALLGIGEEQVFGFEIEFRGEGTYSTSEINSFYYTTVGKDVLTSSYVIDLDKPAKVIIASYDSEQNSINGSFEMFLNKKWSNPENNLNTLSFKEGLFMGTLKVINP